MSLDELGLKKVLAHMINAAISPHVVSDSSAGGFAP